MKPSPGLLWISVIFLGESSSSQALQNVTAKAGRRCVLWSSGPSNSEVKVLRCCRQERYSPFVFFYRDGRVETDGQDPSFSERVKFSTGDLRVVIMNVTCKDSGTYECLVQTTDERMEVSISLMVKPDGEEMTGHKEEPPTNPGDPVRGRDGLFVSACVLAVAVSVLGVRFYKRHTLAENQPGCQRSCS